MPISLVIPVRTSGTLETLKETASTGSTLRRVKVFCGMTTKGGKFRQEIIEVRERLPHVSLKPKLIPHKLFLVIVPSSSAYTLRALRGCFHGEFVMCRFV